MTRPLSYISDISSPLQTQPLYLNPFVYLSQITLFKPTLVNSLLTSTPSPGF